MTKKQWFFVLVVLVLCIMSVRFNTLAAVQESFVLDIYSPLFKYNESLFNDTTSSQENVYNGSENVTFWIAIPKNSTIINATFNVTGKIVPIYEKSVISNGLIGISIGNATPNSYNEISAGTQGNDGTVRLLYGVNGSWIWNSTISVNSQIFSTFIDNVTLDSGDEIAAGSSNDSVYLLNSSGNILWIKDTGGDVKSVKIADLYEDGSNKVIAGSDMVYVLNSSGGENWSSSIGGCTSINELVVGNVTSDSGNEIAVGCNGGKIFILNATGDVVNNVTIGASAINSVDIGNVTSDPGNEIAVGSADNYVYILNSTGDIVWNYSTGGSINSVRIGDVTTQYSGNEVVCGSNDKKVYTLDKDGGLIWDFEAPSFINTIAIGNLTIDDGNEVAAGAGNGYLYTFNFDYFPTNLSIDVGATGGYDWNYSGKLRDTQEVYGINSPIQSFLNTCTEDSSGFCNVSFIFHSDYEGKLNVSAVNITYWYNASGKITYQNVSTWSRTNNIQVNESVGNLVRWITFWQNPANDIEIRYVKVNSTATSCDFNGTTYNTTTVNGDNVCNITPFTVNSTGMTTEDYALLWDNNMSTDVPVYMSELPPYNTTGPDNYYWKKNFTIYNITGFPTMTLTNVTANVTLNDSVVKGLEYLKVWWSAQWCDITPSSESSDCNTSSPSYYSTTCGSDTFWACKIDTNSDSVYDYFDFKQPSFTENTSWQVGGLRNLNANLSSPDVTPSSDIWGENFSYSVYVSDPEGNEVNITLWVRLNTTGVWTSRGFQNVTSSQTVYFNLTSDNTWMGLNSYKFEFQDFNASGDPIHSKENTSVSSGPDVQKHNVSIVHIYGNESSVDREQTVFLIVRVNDTNQSAWVGSGVSCRFWVTTNGSQFDSGHDNVTNSSGHCVFDFTPNNTYSAANQTWVAGVYNDTYYLDMNSSNFVVSVKGRLNVTMLLPHDNQSLLRNSSNYFLARLKDEYGNWVNASGYNCSFWFNDTYINSSDTNATGYCNYSWHPACSVSLGTAWVNVTLSGSASESYNIWNNESHARINMTDELNTSVTNPSDYSSYKKGDNVTLNSTTNDTCELASPGDFNVTWYKKWKRILRIDFNESGGINRTREPFIINGSQLEDFGIDLSDWKINYTIVIQGGSEVESEVKAWTDDNKNETNESQEYPNNYSELVFLLNLDAYQSKTYWIYYNESNPSDYNISYILNGGFENNDTAKWQYIESANCFVADIDRCKGYTTEEGTETTGNYSLYLYSECTTVGCNTVEIEQNLTTQINSSYIKVRYRAWGEFNNASGAYLKVEAGNSSCNLTTTPGTSYPASQWNDYSCYNTSFQSAKNVSIKIHDVLDSGGGMGASHVYIDYICIANSSGDCITLDSGAELPRNVISQTGIGSGDNMTWGIPLNETLGKRRVLANASGDYYQFGQDWVDILIYGWSEVSSGNISSNQCTYNQTFVCMRNATLSLFCNITDANTSLGIENYNVSFYGDDSLLGYNLTNQSGVALWTWENSTDVLGQHNITCNISDQPSL
ncbi:MAG: PQQ-like beta-propeller repeat protein, partial [Candidatus Aenigmatarchaeota archaeon]